MTNYIIRRFIVAVAILFASIIGVSLLIHVVPGDPVIMMIAQNSNPSPEQIENMRKALGLDRPVWEQTVIYLGKVLSGDLGRSIFGSQSVAMLLFDRLPNTLALAAAAMVIATGIGLPLGFFAAYRQGTWIDSVLMVGAVLGVSIPQFWLGLILLLFFSLTLEWLPVASGDYRSLLLPAVTLGVTYSAIIARMTRSAMIEVFTEDFIRTARAKGLPEALVLRRHALKPSLIAVVTIIAVVFGYLMGGAVVVENVFAWNGIGRIALESINRRDYPMIQGFILVFATVIVLISILIDLAYAWLDPRITYR
ncbi:MAG: ABC transporter permease [Alphaproteobacteria bacterium]|nr:ABC transporter permease [Alphaproteobacteria bacterium]